VSHFAQSWAETAPVANVYERAILTLLAHRAHDKDGCGAYPSVASIAEFAVCSPRQVQNVLIALRERGLLAEGEESYANRIPRGRRPQVYDLLIPYHWFSPAQLAEVNKERAEVNKPPLTAADRPPIGPAERRAASRRSTLRAL
jgi:hypothetical protein